MMMVRRFALLLSIATLVGACKTKDVTPGVSIRKVDSVSSATPPHLLSVVANDFSFDAPSTTPSGFTTIHLASKGKELHQVALAKLTDGKTVADFTAALKTPGPPPTWAMALGGANAPMPGGTSEVVQNLVPGHYALICFIPSADGVPHFAKGMVRALTVLEDSAAPAPAPAADVIVTLDDYKFTTSAPLSAGPHMLRIVNAAAQPHELVLLKLQPGKTAQDFVAWINKHNGPPPGALMGGAGGMDKGVEAYLPVSLATGDYALLCFIPDAKDGKPHVAHGMVKEFHIG